ncbi:MAG: tetratricopeptide repeat protein [Chloroflexia bacterium]|nr:tetratricopeptide repeat protein [Chloroflexia bacterium]
MSSLHIRLLGSFAVRRGQAEARFETDAARALLSYLVLQAEIAFSRERLAGLLWPEQAGPEALHALRQTLSRLRSAIGDRQANPPFLHVSRQAIQFNEQGDHWLDVRDFVALLAEVQSHRHRRLESCRFCMHRLEEAAALYRGDLLGGFYLESLPFEEWLFLERERLHRQAMQTFYHLANYYERRGEFERAQDYARRQLELEPWREEGHQQLMRVLALSGQRSAALAQYENSRQLLQEELGVEPGPDTVRLYRQIRDGELEQPSLSASNLPAQLTPFVGRQAELDRIAERLNSMDCRLLTLLGPGGVGKTRLALEAASAERAAFADGVYFVPLAPVSSPDFMAAALAQALQFPLQPGQAPEVQLAHYLRHKELLLVLDGFEHLLSGSDLVLDLLRQAPSLSILTTSRQRLNVAGEWQLPLEGLAWPEPAEVERGDPPTVEDYDAVHLFVQSARRVRPDFRLDRENLPAILHICQLVEGLPLAIELAAAWLQVFSCQEIPEEIQRDLDFLTTSMQGVPERHRSLRAVLDASWSMLSEGEQGLLSRLSVMWGDFDRPAAEEVAGANAALLTALVSKSLLRQESLQGRVRYELHELLRMYAAEKLSAAPAEQQRTLDRHCEHYLQLLSTLKAGTGPEQQRALEGIATEIKDIRSAWDWAIMQGQLAIIDQTMDDLFCFYDEHSWFQEGEAMFGRVVGAFSDTAAAEERALRGRALARRGWFTFRLGQCEQGRALLQQNLTLAQAAGDLQEIVFTLNRLAATALDLGDYDEVRQYARQSLALGRQTGERSEQAHALVMLGQADYYLGDYAEARQHCEESLQLARQQDLPKLAADSLRQLGNLHFTLQHYVQARQYYEQALQIYRQTGNRWGESAALSNAGGVICRQGDYERARRLFEEALQIKEEVGDLWGQANVLSNLGVLANEQGDHMRAVGLFERSALIRRELGALQGLAVVTHNLGVAHVYLGQYERARSLLEQALDMRRELGLREAQMRTLTSLALLWHQLGQDAQSRDLSQQAIHIAWELGVPAGEAEALTNLGHAQAALGQLSEAAEAYQRALSLRRESKRKPALALEPLAGLARVALAGGDLPEAQRLVEEILHSLQGCTLDGIEEPARIYLTCYQVLQAGGDKRAAELLQRARDLLEVRAARIADPDVRQSYLQRVPVHREIGQIVERLNVDG